MNCALKKKVILVTDGDSAAQKAVETAARNIKAHTISRSAGNPTPLTANEILKSIKQSSHEPIVVMADDCGNPGMGIGEEVMKSILEDADIDVLGVVAVASNTDEGDGFKVDCSIQYDGEVVENAVGKDGREKTDKVLIGDTLDILNEYQDIVVVGIGDPGKMDYNDLVESGAPITTRALREILERSHDKNSIK